MAITTQSKKKSQKKLKLTKKQKMIGGGITAFVLILIMWRFVFSPAQVQIPAIPVTRDVPVIDFSYLDSDLFQMFYAPDPIPSYQVGTMGRDNPFLPYR